MVQHAILPSHLAPLKPHLALLDRLPRAPASDLQTSSPSPHIASFAAAGPVEKDVCVGDERFDPWRGRPPAPPQVEPDGTAGPGGNARHLDDPPPPTLDARQKGGATGGAGLEGAWGRLRGTSGGVRIGVRVERRAPAAGAMKEVGQA